MASGLNSELLFAAFCIFVFGTIIASRVIAVPAALAVSSLKVLLPLFYFAFFYNDDWALIDGAKYFSSGQELLAAGHTPLSIFDPEAVIQSMIIANGHHVLYDWYNVLAQWLFGDMYAASVFLNVGLTFWGAYILFRIAALFDFPPVYCKGLFIFFLLHWELLSWTSVANLKDSLVLFLTVAMSYAGISYAKSRQARHLGLIALLLFLFYWIRFYVPLLMIGAVFVYSISLFTGRSRMFIIVGGAVLIGVYGSVLGWQGLSEGVGKLALGPAIVGGTAKVIIVPRPWGLESEYTFLTVAAMLHWIFLVPTVLGVAQLWRAVPQLRFLFIYLAIILLFYGAFEELQGARQRIQVLFIYGWAQFHFLWHMLRFIRPAPSQAEVSCV